MQNKTISYHGYNRGRRERRTTGVKGNEEAVPQGTTKERAEELSNCGLQEAET